MKLAHASNLVAEVVVVPYLEYQRRNSPKFTLPSMASEASSNAYAVVACTTFAGPTKRFRGPSGVLGEFVVTSNST